MGLRHFFIYGLSESSSECIGKTVFCMDRRHSIIFRVMSTDLEKNAKVECKEFGFTLFFSKISLEHKGSSASTKFARSFLTSVTTTSVLC